MCSISGFFNYNGRYLSYEGHYQDLLSEMNEQQRHRGPDDAGIFLDNRCGLSHTRLSIRDLKDGGQPMTRMSHDRSFTIVYNGELYNAEEIKSDLASRGYAFSTTSDTEVILMAYICYGAAFVKRLNGIFAFAVYDQSEGTVFLYRDPCGVKPLYYMIRPDGTLVFASERKAIFSYPGVTPKLDRAGLCEIFALGPSKTPGCGVFKGISELKPGYYLRYDRYGIKNIRYFQLKSLPHEDDYQTTVETTGRLLRDAITRQIISDVPICTFLSGGIDSSIVSAVCAGVLKERGETLSTYSFDFTDNERFFQSNAFQPEQDRPYVEQMVSYLQTDHRHLTCDMESLADLLYDSVRSRDMPTMADVDSSLLYFCHLVAENHKVVLTGECADEIFGGYPWFYREDLLQADTFPWMIDLTPRKMLLRRDVLEALSMDDYVNACYRSVISEIEVLPEESELEKSRRRIGYLNIRMFMQTLLDRMDRTSMASGLEARVPFADLPLLQYVFNVPWKYKYQNQTEKSLLRHAVSGLVPHDILFRKKSPYPKTYNPLYEQILANRLRDVISDPQSPVNQFVEPNAVLAFLGAPKDYGKPWYGQLMAGPQMMAYLLQINYWLDAYQIKVSL